MQPFPADAKVAESWQELSRSPVPAGTPGSLPVHTTVMDQPPQPSPHPPYSVHTWVFFLPHLWVPFCRPSKSTRVLQDQEELQALLSGLLSPGRKIRQIL